MAKQLVKLRTKPSRDGRQFTYVLDYKNEHGRRTRISLGHADRQKAERQRAQRQRELTMGCVVVEDTRLSELLVDSRTRTLGQVRETTLSEWGIAMRHFIETVGDLDVRAVKHRHGETFIQACLDKGNSPATANKKIGCLKRMFQLALVRGRCPANNFGRGFRMLLERAQIESGEFHDLRRTCLSRWLANGLTEYDVMQLAGHSDFSTTHRFYLAVRTDLIDRARAAMRAALRGHFGTRLARAPISG